MEKWAPKERKKREGKKAKKKECNLAIYDIMYCNKELKNPREATKIIYEHLRYK